MSKFCGNCGTELPDDALSCTNCGANVGAPAEAAAADTQGTTPTDAAVAFVKDKGGAFIEKLKSDKKFLGIVLGAVAAIIVLIIVLTCFVGGGKQKAVQNHFEAMISGDWDTYYDCFPDEYWEKFEENLKEEYDEAKENDYDLDSYPKDLDAYREKWEEQIETVIELAEEKYGEDISISVVITDEDEVDEDDFKEIRDNLKESWGVNKKDITDAVEVEVEATIEGDDDEDSNDENYILVKVNGDWYVYNG